MIAYKKNTPLFAYGSSRLGIYESNTTIAWRNAFDANNDNQISEAEYNVGNANNTGFLFANLSGYRGKIRYEMSNHLGNVLTVVSDKKLAVCSNGSFVSYSAEVISATDYSPFGAPLAGRTFEGGGYRFAFNGQEQDNEIAGTGNILTAEFWMYDGRLGRRWNVDPKPRIGFSDYSVLGNNPSFNIDPFGDYFFGLFGSTSEQRNAAKEFQSKNGGVIKNYHSRHIKVEYSTGILTFDHEICKSVFTVVAQSMYFNANGYPVLSSPGSINIDSWFWRVFGGSTYGELSGNDNPANDRKYSPDGLQYSIGGNVLNYSGSVNLSYVKGDAVGLNVTHSNENAGSSIVSLSQTFSEITFNPDVSKADRNLSSLAGKGQNKSGSFGPLSIGSGVGFNEKGRPIFTSISFGTGLPGRLGDLNISPLKGASGSIENNTTSSSVKLINLETK